MSWKVHETDEVFAELRGMCSNAYRMYDPCENRYYYDHDCETYECAVDEAAEEYERLVEHCAHQREQLAKRSRSKTIGILMELLNEYRLSECALDEGRVSWYAARLDGRTVNEHWMNGERTEEGAAMSITDELRMYVQDWRDTPSLMDGLDRGDVDGILEDFISIADRIDERHMRGMADAELSAAPTETQLAELGWVRLPKDADGVPIRIGDLVEADGDAFNVMSMELFFDGSWSIRNDVGNGFEYWELHHVKPDSWERIIEDAFFESQEHFGSADAVRKLVERCERLAGR